MTAADKAQGGSPGASPNATHAGGEAAAQGPAAPLPAPASPQLSAALGAPAVLSHLPLHHGSITVRQAPETHGPRQTCLSPPQPSLSLTSRQCRAAGRLGEYERTRTLHRAQKTPQQCSSPNVDRGGFSSGHPPTRPDSPDTADGQTNRQDHPAKGHCRGSHPLSCSYFTLESKAWIQFSYSGSIFLDLFPFVLH